MSGRRTSRHRRAERARERLELALVLGREEASLRGELEAVLSSLDEADARAERERLQGAEAAIREGGGRLSSFAREVGLGGLWLTTTSGGAQIVRVRAETFPGHVNYVYALVLGEERVLWDVGTGHATSRADILTGLEAAGLLFGLDLALPSFDVVLISHGHIDHFGDVKWFKEATGGRVWVHELDARVLEHWAERTVMTGRDMRAWLEKAGLTEGRTDQLTSLYLGSKALYSSEGVVVDRRLRHGQSLFGDRARVLHTPGHCPGHLCLLVDDALLVADQVLSPITPHISPQALHPYCGIDRYLAGLSRLRGLTGVRHVLPAHYDDIPDLGGRIDDIARHHAERSQQIAAFCREPRTVKEVAREVYGEQSGYHVLLALQEAGAHVEYLHQVGALSIANLADLEADPSAPVRYQADEQRAAGSVLTARPDDR